MAVDIADSTARADATKIRLRRVLYEAFENSLYAAGAEERLRDPLVDRGDGILAVIHPIVPKTLLLNAFVPALCEELSRQQELRLRVVVHAGEVLYDRRGCCGEALDLSFRLLDAPALKGALAKSAAPLVLVVSEEMYRTIVRHGYRGIDDDAFAPLVQTHIAGRTHWGWVRVSGGVTHVADKLGA
ncbi:hypothetical protein FHS29_007102 [Saccharothrix tamanrassetensis]|uniref:Uncharacterized protein n=1 Tax=Saccharothrix tamanrassetensis TaxID=1051531 RepID=A0A841CWI6_9PSEU|nr:hypothetical protein [Saccharothrix tamanrassetensis]MBB5960478.1 hypothetical protein [Saccharothrix tamanrassetensis]